MSNHKGTCVYPGCGRPISRRDLCQTHRIAEDRGQPLQPIATLMARAGTCSFPNCGRQIKSKRLCKIHYDQRRAGVQLKPVQVRGPLLPCSAPRCDGLAKVKGLCMAHYHQQRRNKPFTAVNRYASTEQRFWSKVVESDPPAHDVTMGPCWSWTSTRQKSGHGSFGLSSGKTVRAYRWAYESMVALIPEGLSIDHLCRNPACVNPYHLEPVPLSVNIARIPKVTHCRHGHEYTTENTYWPSDGSARKCRECGRIRCRENNARKAANRYAPLTG